MQGDTLTTALFFAGSGIALVIAAVNQAGWKHRLIISGLLGFGIVFCAIGLLWPFITHLSPTFTGLVVSIATTPSSWFTLVMFCAAAILLAPQKREPVASLPLSKIDSLNAEKLSALQKEIDLTNKKLSAWADQLGERIADGVDANQKNELTALIGAVQQLLIGRIEKAELGIAEQTTKARMASDNISEKIQGYLTMLRADDLDLKHIIYFGILEATLAYLEGLVEEAPKREIPLAADVSDGARKEMYSLHQGFVQKALNHLDGDRYSRAYGVISNAENEAEEHVRAIECPPHINLLDMRRYEIAISQTMRMLAFLEFERRDITEKIRMNRSRLMERYETREKDKR
jgi:hypothetical protein